MNINPDTIIALANKTADRIASYITNTPVHKLQSLSNESRDVYVKCENLQDTGSFKLRGAASKITQLSQDGISNAITASTGNHGMACAKIMSKLGINGKIFVPTSISPDKEKKLLQHNVQLVKIEGDSKEVEVEARNQALQEGIPFISPYNDPDIISGQATIGLELVDFFTSATNIEKTGIDYVFSTVGGGGLISGIASIIKSEFPAAKVIACQPANSAVMYHSIEAGRILDIESQATISDGSAGGIEADSITFPLARQLIDDFVLVSEEDIKQGMRFAHEELNMVIEGAAAVALIGCMKYIHEYNIQGNVVVILCGSNIDAELWSTIIE